MKVVDKMNAAQKAGETFFSFEFFPPRTEEASFDGHVLHDGLSSGRSEITYGNCVLQGVENLFDRMDRMATHDPTFCDITWGAGGTTADLTLEIAGKMQNMVCKLLYKASIVHCTYRLVLLPSICQDKLSH